MPASPRAQKKSIAHSRSAEMRHQLENGIKPTAFTTPSKGGKGQRRTRGSKASTGSTPKIQVSYANTPQTAKRGSKMAQKDGYVLNQRGRYECEDKHGHWFECVITGKQNAPQAHKEQYGRHDSKPNLSMDKFVVNVMTPSGVTLHNKLVNSWEIAAFGTHSMASPTDFTQTGLPNKFTESICCPECHDAEFSCDWNAEGIPSRIAGVDWSSHYNQPYASRYKTQAFEDEIICDWSVKNLPRSISSGGAPNLSWCDGAYESMLDPEVPCVDWSQDGLNWELTGNLSWIRYANEPEPELTCDWSVGGIPTRISHDIAWKSNYKGLMRAMYNKPNLKFNEQFFGL
jgi:hypothetical protein